MSGASLTALIVGISSLMGGIAALLQAKYEGKRKKVEGTTIGEAALANAVKVVEEVYDKVTGRMNAQIDELLEDNAHLRHELSAVREAIDVIKETERKCRAEVAMLRLEVQEARAEKG